MYGKDPTSLRRSAFYANFNIQFRHKYKFHRPINDCCSDCLILSDLVQKCKSSKESLQFVNKIESCLENHVKEADIRYSQWQKDKKKALIFENIIENLNAL